MEYKTPPNVTYYSPTQPQKTSTSMLPSLISGGASLLGGAIDAISDSIHHKQDLKMQREENQKNRDHAEMMYKKYESPQAQAAQLSAAGLNPAAQGAVSTQSVGSASTSSLPTSQPSTFGSSIAQGAAEAVNGYVQRKQFQKQLDATILSDVRKNFLEWAKLGLDRQDKEKQWQVLKAELDLKGLSKKYQEMLNEEFKQFLDSGGNRFIDDSNVKFTQMVDNIISTYTKSMDESRKADLHKYEKEFAQLRNHNLNDIIYDHTIKEIGHRMGIDIDSTPDYLRGFTTYAILCNFAFETGHMSYNDFKKTETAVKDALSTWSNNAAQFADPNSLTEAERQRLNNEQTKLVMELYKTFNPLSALSD